MSDEISKEPNRLEEIASGKKVEAVIHDKVHEAETTLEIENFSLWYGKKQALHEISMPIPRGEVTALIGPSGCGKSTLLRSVNRMNDLIDGLTIRGDIRLAGDPSLRPGGRDRITQADGNGFSKTQSVSHEHLRMWSIRYESTANVTRRC